MSLLERIEGAKLTEGEISAWGSPAALAQHEKDKSDLLWGVAELLEQVAQDFGAGIGTGDPGDRWHEGGRMGAWEAKGRVMQVIKSQGIPKPGWAS